jgi:polyferredoxin
VKIVRLRRVSQIAFAALFLFLFFQTEFRGSWHAARTGTRLPLPVSLFLQADPLAALVNALGSGALYRGLLWSLIIIVPTLFLGRFFCGWVCPLGTLNHWLGSWRSDSKRGPRAIEANRYHRWQALKYYVLIGVLAAALFGSGIAGLLDPLSLLVRSLATSILPAVNYALDAALDPLSRSNWIGARYISATGNIVFNGTLLAFKQPYFRQGFFLGVVFLLILALNLRITRFWCRAVCPLGALLGLLSRWSVLGLAKRPGNCDNCNRCLLHCQGGDDPLPGVPWRKPECHFCMNCVADCPRQGIAFKFFAREHTRALPDLRRRHALTGLAAGVAAVPLLRASAGLSADHHERRLRPPGALDEKTFLARCIRCGQCLKVCPNNALQPALTEAGFEGLWTPVLAARIGYCEPSCLLCGQACPTGAIWEFTAAEKGWAPTSANPIRIGTAFYDRGRCLPWAMSTECIVCEEWCPTSPKAIYLRPAGDVRQPYIDPARCIGCGACEYACPVKDRPAVYVTSIGESRTKSNQILLRRASAAPDVFPGSAPGWTRTGEIRVFPADNLWQYIDGDADRYLKAGVVRTLTAHYRHATGADAVVDVYVMSAPEGARRIFEGEPDAGSRPAAIGDAARLWPAALTFRQGPYFVRLVAYTEAPDALADLARAVSAKLRTTP